MNATDSSPQAQFVDIRSFFEGPAQRFFDQTTPCKPLNAGSDSIWQHMKVGYFESLLHQKALYFRPIISYSNELEPNPASCFFRPEEMITQEAFVLGSKFETLGAHTYLSCWYHGPYVVDGIFKRFTSDKQGKPEQRGGLAIRTNVKRLLECIRTNTQDDHFIRAYYGLVQYIPSKYLAEHVRPAFQSLVKQYGKIDGAIPYYFKKSNLGDECEFRLLIRLFTRAEHDGSLRNLAPDSGRTEYLLPIKIADVIEGFAIPAAYYPFDKSFADSLKEHHWTATEEKKAMDGYRYFHLEAER